MIVTVLLTSYIVCFWLIIHQTRVSHDLIITDNSDLLIYTACWYCVHASCHETAKGLAISSSPTNSRDPNQISQNVVSDQETLKYMLHVRSLSSIILIRKCHNHRILAFHLTANPYLYIFWDVWLLYESFSTYAYEQRCQWGVCVDAHACVFLNFLHGSNTQNSHARLKCDLRHALIMEETHLFEFNIHLYLKLSTKCSNIKSTSMKISDLSVNSQKTLKWLFTVDCQ